MNFIRGLFSHHRHAEHPSQATISWRGQSGNEYRYQVYPLEIAFQPLPGNYIYAKQADDGSWIPIYIAQTRDLHQRLEGKVRVGDAVESGATHIHAHYCSNGQAARCTEERDLILAWQPVCNEPVEV